VPYAQREDCAADVVWRTQLQPPIAGLAFPGWLRSGRASCLGKPDQHVACATTRRPLDVVLPARWPQAGPRPGGCVRAPPSVVPQGQNPERGAALRCAPDIAV